MTSEVSVVHAGEQPDVDEWTASIFLAGPMPREVSVPSWRPAVFKALEEAWSGPGTLVVFVPEARNWQPFRYDHHQWEDRWLSIVDVICFWVPRDMQRMPGMNTNIEFGRWENSGRLVLGAPPEATGVGYLRECAAREGAPVAESIDAAVTAAIKMIGAGAARAGGLRDVPLLLWQTPEFQQWLETQAAQGKKMTGGRLLWAHDLSRQGPRYWAFQASFGDTTEIVLGRNGKLL